MKNIKYARCLSLVLSIICSVGIICGTVLTTEAEGARQETKVVKVGYDDYAGFIECDDNGEYTGYAVDYLKEIAKYTGWKYEFIYDTWDGMMERLKTGDIEMICSAQYTPQRDEYYDFSDQAVGYETCVLYTRMDDDRYYFEDFDAFNGMKIGCMKGSFQNDTFREYAAKNNFSYQEVDFITDVEAFAQLDSGALDAVIMGGLSLRTGYKIVSEFSADPFYLMVPNGRTDLLDPINDALMKIRVKNPYFQEDLYHTYYASNYENTTPSFTREEAEYIKNAGVIKVGNQINRYPLVDQDADGNVYGIQIDAMELLSQMSGLKFEYEAVDGGIRATDYLKNSDAGIFNGMMKSEMTHFAPDIILSDPIVSSDVTLIGRTGDMMETEDAITVALPANFVSGQDALRKMLPNATYISCDTNEDCLKALLTGAADNCVLDQYIATALLQRPKYESLSAIDAYKIEQQLCVAVLDTQDPLLMSILNKCIARLDTDTLTKSIATYTFGTPYHLTFSDYLYKYKVPFMVIAFLVVFCFALLAVTLMIRLRSAQKINAANEELEKSNRELETKNDQLAAAIQKANDANEAKSRFLAQMSHEIRTPMNAIIGLTNIAQTEVDNRTKMENYLRKIDSSSKLLLGIINDVLDMSAIESNKLKIANIEFDLKQLLTNITTVFYQQCRQKDIFFDVRMNGVTQEVLIGDSLRLNQILMNLLSNAVKFTPAGGTISMNVIQASMSNDTVHMRFIVADTGCGMSEDLKKRLFNPFEQEDATTARKHGGSGLGLAISRNIVEMMHGSIKVDSEKDKGTTFTVDIPFKMVQNHIKMDKEAFSKIRALIVDDDSEAGNYTSILLDRLGVNHTYVDNGEAALEALGEADDQGTPYNIAIVDWKMPEMNGVELTKEIRNVFGDDTIVIIASAYDLNEVETEGRQAGADYFIPKPLFQSSVFNILMQISDGKYSQVELQPENSKKDFYFAGKKVLVAEDVALNMEVAVQLLKMAGLDVVCAEDGQIAVDIFKRSREYEFDAILMDINMPNMDGYEAAREIRKCDRSDARDMPIYAMTANAFTEDVAAALDAGMNGHIAKPIEQAVLYKTLQNAFEKH